MKPGDKGSVTIIRPRHTYWGSAGRMTLVALLLTMMVVVVVCCGECGGIIGLWPSLRFSAGGLEWSECRGARAALYLTRQTQVPPRWRHGTATHWTLSLECLSLLSSLGFPSPPPRFTRPVFCVVTYCLSLEVTLASLPSCRENYTAKYTVL